jgi:hypothetical protein
MMDSGISTSMVRPFSRSATTLNVGSAASGSSPPPSSTAAVPTSGSTVETERDLIAFANLSVGSFLLLPGTYVLFLFYEVFCNLLYIHRVELMNASRPFGALPFKKREKMWLSMVSVALVHPHIYSRGAIGCLGAFFWLSGAMRCGAWVAPCNATMLLVIFFGVVW